MANYRQREKERERDIITSLVSSSIHLSSHAATVITPLPHHHGYTLLPAHLYAFGNLWIMCDSPLAPSASERERDSHIKSVRVNKRWLLPPLEDLMLQEREWKKKETSDCAFAFPGKEMSWVTVATGITNRHWWEALFSSTGYLTSELLLTLSSGLASIVITIFVLTDFVHAGNIMLCCEIKGLCGIVYKMQPQDPLKALMKWPWCFSYGINANSKYQ